MEQADDRIGVLAQDRDNTGIRWGNTRHQGLRIHRGQVFAGISDHRSECLVSECNVAGVIDGQDRDGESVEGEQGREVAQELGCRLVARAPTAFVS